LDLRIQYWTSRGFAVLDVNYRGSTGFGRAYRHGLDGQWGVLDVDDCVAGAKHLVELGKADEHRLIITGSSAGGYTTLAALTFRDAFRAGASHYGISDLEALARDTHKFEARYLDRLVGAYPAQKSIYEERSPVHFPERLSCPLIFFQGLRDKVVPPNQAETMVEALKARGLPVAYVTFAEEAHGFRQADNIKRALDAELYFYARVFGLELPEEPDPVEIANLREEFLY
jgi:dipeptidyl aminopeptidase/acylaminoacyl peptidase